MTKPVLLDLFCCQGGASRGYAEAGFEVIGVDIDPQPRYPFPFRRFDALRALEDLRLARSLPSGPGNITDISYRVPITGAGWNEEEEPIGPSVMVSLKSIRAIHASPPCQAHTLAQRIMGNEHVDLIEPTRALLNEIGLPYVIENVPGSPLIEPVELCGEMFGLQTYRHRLFETNWVLNPPDHPAHVARTTKMGRRPVEGEYMHVVGNFSGVDQARTVMGMPWANRDGLREAIPPAYTEYIGRQLMQHVRAGKEAA